MTTWRHSTPRALPGPEPSLSHAEAGEVLRGDPLWSELGAFAADLGVRCWSYGAVPANVVRCETPWPNVGTYPSGHVRTTRERHLYRSNPSLDFVRSERPLSTFAEVREAARVDATFRELLDLNRQYDVRHGLLVPLRNVLGMHAWLALCYGASPSELEDVHHAAGARIQSFAEGLNQRILKTHARTIVTPYLPPLGERALAAMSLLARGATTEEIADALHISVHTVNKHIARAKRSLGARSSAQLTALGLQWGLID